MLLEVISDQKTITVFHGTYTQKVESIKKNGLESPAMGYQSAGWYMVSTDFESALFHATPIDEDDVYVFEFEVPLEKSKYWFGFPYLWPGNKRNEHSMWFSLRQPLLPSFIKNVHQVSYDKWLEQKSRGF